MAAASQFLIEAQIEAEIHDIPLIAVDRYAAQANQAVRRGIAWEMTLKQWWGWWQYLDRWNRRGRKADSLVMARFADEGPYNINNIYCTSRRENIWHIEREKISDAHKALWAR